MLNINESYLIKQIQRRVASCMSAFMHDTGAKIMWRPGAWDDTEVKQIISVDSHWRIENQKLYFSYSEQDSKKEGVYFSGTRYSPEDSKIIYGDSVQVSDIEARDDDQSKVFDNRKGKQPFHVAFEQAVELANSVEHTMAKSMHMDVTSKTTVGGGYAGVHAEEELSIAFGVSFDNSKTTNESKTATDTVAVEFDVEPGEAVLLEIKKEHFRSHTPFSVDGVLDFNMIFDYYDDGKRDNSKYINWSHWIELASVAELEQFIHGYDTKYPHMAGYWEHGSVSRVRNGIEWILDPENRRIVCEGIKERIIEKNATYEAVNIGSKVPDNLQVVDVSNLPEMN